MGLTNIEWGIFSFSKVIDVGDAQRCDGSFSNPPQCVPHENIDPHVGTRVFHTRYKMTRTHVTFYIAYVAFSIWGFGPSRLLLTDSFDLKENVVHVYKKV